MSKPIVLVSDFCSGDYGIPAMKGVCKAFDPCARVFDLCHDVPPMNVEKAAELIVESLSNWPEDSVFVSAVDPGYTPGRDVYAYKLKCGPVIVAPAKEAFDAVIRSKTDVEYVDVITAHSVKYASGEGPGALHGRDLAYCGAVMAQE